MKLRRLARTIGWLTAGWAAWRLFGPDSRPRFSAGQDRPLRVPGRTVFVGPHELFVREVGPIGAPAVVLLHGAGFDGETTFFRVIPGLAGRYRLIVPDHRTYGKSDRWRGRIEVEDLADDLAGVLDAVGVDRAAVVGFSLGGMVAQAFALRHPDRVERLVLAATAAHAFAPVRHPLRLAMWLARGVTRLSITDQVLVVYRQLLRSGAVERRHGQWMWNALMSRDAALYWETTGALWRFDARPSLVRLTMPILQIVTRRDQVILAPWQRQLTGFLPKAQVVEVDAGHEAMMSHAGLLTECIDDFLSPMTQAPEIDDGVARQG